MNGRVIVGYDGSAPATEAVWWASAEALRRNVPLLIVSCFDLPIVETPSVELSLNVYDVLQRRTSIAFTGQATVEAATEIAAVIAPELGWDAARQSAEVDRALAHVHAAEPGRATVDTR